MGKEVVLLSVGLLVAVGSGCVATTPVTSASCPAAETATTVPYLDTIPILRDDGMKCVIWQRNEGDGHVARFVLKRDGNVVLKEVRLSEESYQSLLKIVEHLIAQTPQFRTRQLWTLCSTEDAESI